MSYPSGSGPSDLIGTPTAPVGSPYPITSTTVTDLLYSFYNFGIATGSYLSTGSPTLDLTSYTTKSVFAYIGTALSASGSLKISGSFDRTNWFLYTSSGFHSGSLQRCIFTDPVPFAGFYLVIGEVTGSTCSGSLYVFGRSN